MQRNNTPMNAPILVSLTNFIKIEDTTKNVPVLVNFSNFIVTEQRELSRKNTYERINGDEELKYSAEYRQTTHTTFVERHEQIKNIPRHNAPKVSSKLNQNGESKMFSLNPNAEEFTPIPVVTERKEPSHKNTQERINGDEEMKYNAEYRQTTHTTFVERHEQIKNIPRHKTLQSVLHEITMEASMVNVRNSHTHSDQRHRTGNSQTSDKRNVNEFPENFILADRATQSTREHNPMVQPGTWQSPVNSRSSVTTSSAAVQNEINLNGDVTSAVPKTFTKSAPKVSSKLNQNGETKMFTFNPNAKEFTPMPVVTERKEHSRKNTQERINGDEELKYSADRRNTHTTCTERHEQIKENTPRHKTLQSALHEITMEANMVNVRNSHTHSDQRHRMGNRPSQTSGRRNLNKFPENFMLADRVTESIRRHNSTAQPGAQPSSVNSMNSVTTNSTAVQDETNLNSDVNSAAPKTLTKSAPKVSSKLNQNGESKMFTLNPNAKEFKPIPVPQQRHQLMPQSCHRVDGQQLLPLRHFYHGESWSGRMMLVSPRQNRYLTLTQPFKPLTYSQWSQGQITPDPWRSAVNRENHPARSLM